MQSNDVKERQTIVSDQYFSLVANVDINKVVIGQNFSWLPIHKPSLLILIRQFPEDIRNSSVYHQMAVCTGSGVVLGRTGEIGSDTQTTCCTVFRIILFGNFILSQWIN